MTFIRKGRYSPDGKVFAFQNLDDLYVIVGDQLLNGAIDGDELITVRDGKITVQKL